MYIESDIRLSLKCLEGLSALELLAQSSYQPESARLMWAPTDDGDFLAEAPRKLIEKLDFKRSSILISISVLLMKRKC